MVLHLPGECYMTRQSIRITFGFQFFFWQILKTKLANWFAAPTGQYLLLIAMRSSWQLSQTSIIFQLLQSFLCPECGAAFKSNSALIDHRKRVHLQVTLTNNFHNVVCCCKLNNAQDCDEHLYMYRSYRSRSGQLPIFHGTNVHPQRYACP